MPDSSRPFAALRGCIMSTQWLVNKAVLPKWDQNLTKLFIISEFCSLACVPQWQSKLTLPSCWHATGSFVDYWTFMCISVISIFQGKYRKRYRDFWHRHMFCAWRGKSYFCIIRTISLLSNCGNSISDFRNMENLQHEKQKLVAHKKEDITGDPTVNMRNVQIWIEVFIRFSWATLISYASENNSFVASFMHLKLKRGHQEDWREQGGYNFWLFQSCISC